MKAHRYRIKDWPERFESAKSKTYKHKQQVYMPNKFGLGYHRMVRAGEEIYGAWCAMVCLLSRQEAPREGYVTDSGKRDGTPLTAQDIAITTGFSEKTVQRMIEFASSEVVGWMQVADSTDTAGIPQYPHGIPDKDTSRILQSPYPLPLPSHLPSPSPSLVADSSFHEKPDIDNPVQLYSEGFKRLVKEWPRKVTNEYEVYREYEAIANRPSDEYLIEAMEAMKKKKGEEWAKDGGKYAPGLVRWLRERMFLQSGVASEGKQDGDKQDGYPREMVRPNGWDTFTLAEQVGYVHMWKTEGPGRGK